MSVKAILIVISNGVLDVSLIRVVEALRKIPRINHHGGIGISHTNVVGKVAEIELLEGQNTANNTGRHGGSAVINKCIENLGISAARRPALLNQISISGSPGSTLKATGSLSECTGNIIDDLIANAFVDRAKRDHVGKTVLNKSVTSLANRRFVSGGRAIGKGFKKGFPISRRINTSVGVKRLRASIKSVIYSNLRSIRLHVKRPKSLLGASRNSKSRRINVLQIRNFGKMDGYMIMKIRININVAKINGSAVGGITGFKLVKKSGVGKGRRNARTTNLTNAGRRNTGKSLAPTIRIRADLKNGRDIIDHRSDMLGIASGGFKIRRSVF